MGTIRRRQIQIPSSRQVLKKTRKIVEVFYNDKFERFLNKIKDASFLDQIKKLIRKIIENPEIGKPMKFERKGTREVYVGSYRLAYAFLKEEDRLVFLEIYHKNEQ